MLRTPLNLNYLKRTIRPLYANTQATPKAVLLDPAWDSSVDIYPGMAMMKTTGTNVTLINGTGTIYGLADFFEAPVLGIREITDSGINAAAVWVLGPDSEFQILAPAFDTTVTWTDPGDGTTTLITAYVAGAKRGQLVPVGTASAGGNTVGTNPIARLISVNSASSITIGGLQSRVA